MKAGLIARRFHLSFRTLSVIGLFLVLLTLLCSSGIAAYQISGTIGRPVNGGQLPDIGSDGRIWLPVYSDNIVLVFEPNGNPAPFSPIQFGQDQSGSRKRIENPSGAVVSQGIAYVTNDSYAGERMIYRFNAQTGAPLPGFRPYYSVADIDADAQGHLFVVEKVGRAIHVLDTNGKELPGSPIALPSGYQNFRGISVSPDSRVIYVAVEKPGVIFRLVGKTETSQVIYGKPEIFVNNLNQPGSVNIAPDGRIFICEGSTDRVLIYSQDGRLIDKIEGGSPKLKIPRGVAFSKDGKTIFIAQFAAAALQVWQAEGTTPSNTGSDIKTTPTAAPAASFVAPFFIQTGAFQVAQSAVDMKSALEKAGYANVRILQVSTLNRVQIGGFQKQEDADKLAREIRDKFVFPNFSGALVFDSKDNQVNFYPLSLAPTANRTAPSVASAPKSGMGYWLQIGAYASEDNVKAVKAKIEQLGYANVHAIQEPWRTMTVKKVRMGPYATMKDAVRVQSDLKNRLKFPGLTGDYWIFTAPVGKDFNPTVSYRVLVSKFKESIEAARLKAALESQGRYPVFVDNNPPTFDVTVGNYPTESEAAGLLKSLKEASYIDSVVVRASDVAPPPELTPEQKTVIEERQKTAEESVTRGEYTKAIMQFEELMKQVNNQTDIIKRLEEINKRLSDKQREELEKEKKKKAEDEDIVSKVKIYHSNALSFWEEGNADSAISEWQKVLRLDPGNATAKYFIEQARKSKESLPDAQKEELAKKAELNKQMEKMYSEAQQAYMNKDYDTALAKYRTIFEKDPTSPQGRNAQEAISRIEGEKSSASGTSSGETSGSSKSETLMQYGTYAGIGVGVLIALYVIFLLFKKVTEYLKSRPKSEKTEKLPKLKKGKAPTGGTMAQMIAPPEDHSKERELTQEQMESKKQGEEWYKKGLDAMEQNNLEDAINFFLTAASLDPNNPEPRGKVSLCKAKMQEQNLMQAKKQAMSQAETQIVPPSAPPASEAVPTISIGSRPPAAPAGETTIAATAVPVPSPTPIPVAPPTPIPTPSQAAETTIIATAIVPPPAAPVIQFEQNFDNETSGASPEGWTGDFAHATLQVNDVVTANNSGKAVKFEKPEGTATTHYRKRFNDMKGKFTVEFDIRCDAKNKYFLGVYLECDEDFRKAVHTVIHTAEDGSSASLRLQGESVPYQLGSWSHVKYVLDLPDATVDAYVNNQLVVQAARIPGTPEMINTISIRDNPATTATLFIDNVKIYTA